MKISQKNQNEIINNFYFDGLMIGTTQSQTEVCNGMHYHEKPAICFLLQGGGVEKRTHGSYERFANDARFYYAAEPHHSDIRIFPSKCINLEFTDDFLRRYDVSENMINSAVGKNSDVKFAMLKMYRELLADDFLTDSSVKILLFGMLGKEESKKPLWITKLYEILNDRWAETVSLEELAVTLNVHPVTISKYFTRYFSCTYGEYMRKLKIDRSLFLIKNSELSLTEIALQCGFADQSHFTRNFKKITGFLPKDFKQF